MAPGAERQAASCWAQAWQPEYWATQNAWLALGAVRQLLSWESQKETLVELGVVVVAVVVETLDELTIAVVERERAAEAKKVELRMANFILDVMLWL